jgi:hypothetical protein
MTTRVAKTFAVTGTTCADCTVKVYKSTGAAGASGPASTLLGTVTATANGAFSYAPGSSLAVGTRPRPPRPRRSGSSRPRRRTLRSPGSGGRPRGRPRDGGHPPTFAGLGAWRSSAVRDFWSAASLVAAGGAGGVADVDDGHEARHGVHVLIVATAACAAARAPPADPADVAPTGCKVRGFLRDFFERSPADSGGLGRMTATSRKAGKARLGGPFLYQWVVGCQGR